ncbi:MAG: hypothetical protein IJS27_00440 [Ruminococcus sp.]|nr:hypothetical protein [Ruminococcus sp.]
MKKILSLILALMMVMSVLVACGEDKNNNNSSGSGGNTPAFVSDPVNTLKAEQSTDKYRSYYQVWIGAFHDSDGDGTGDLPGVIEKLDYINDGDPNSGDDLGADGIWLSPMMPSSTYHKYNVEDYYTIDEEFGTLDDFDKLLKEAHDRGIVVIIDLVVNHAGARHEFFQKACEELRQGKEDGYARYFNFSKTQSPVYQHKVSGSDYWYQGDFWDQMPDWNLSFEGTREYFEDVVKFWLDRGVDGFRLDAVKYFDDDHTDGKEFMKWFYDMAKGYKDDVYMVGEDWTETGDIYDMYESGIDSLFNFKFAGTGGEFLMASGAMENFTKKLKKYDNNIHEHNANAINANFLTNHDMNRLASMIETEDNKIAAAVYMLSPGNSFTYYGEEIGIEAPNSNGDANYRTAMVWDSDDLPKIDTEGIKADDTAPLGGVKQQLADSSSLLNTYRKLIKIRMQNPEIARGTVGDTVSFSDPDCAGYIIESDGAKLLVIHNASKDDKELTVDMITSPELRGWSTAQEKADGVSVTLDGATLKLPARTSVVLKETK